MGDILHALPAVTALRAAYPAAKIGWLIEERWQGLLRSTKSDGRSQQQPLVDRVHVTKMVEWRKRRIARQTREEVSTTVRGLWAEEYECAIDLQGAFRSAFFARMSRAHMVYGEYSPREWPARLFFDQRVKTRGVHVVEQDLEVVSALAQKELTYVPPLLPHDAEAERWAAEIAGDARSVVINPGAGWGAKCWPAERYGAVARSLLDDGLRVVVNAGPGERALAEKVAGVCGGAARIAECSIAELIALTRRAALMVAGDTGPLHLAAALAVPTVAIFGPTDPGRNGPFGNRSIVLRSPMSRRDHSRHSKPDLGLLTIDVEQVIAASRSLLTSREAPR